MLWREKVPPTVPYRRRLAWSLFLGGLKLSMGGSAGDLPIRETAWVQILVRFQLHAGLLFMLNHHRSEWGFAASAVSVEEVGSTDVEEVIGVGLPLIGDGVSAVYLLLCMPRGTAGLLLVYPPIVMKRT
ncbi:hypothetical protein HOY80DRAFT_97329 [Tuber brumale]|nr:hypothetical protein HOY80DRAFT_97329 [Tuber brumale]